MSTSAIIFLPLLLALGIIYFVNKNKKKNVKYYKNSNRDALRDASIEKLEKLEKERLEAFKEEALRKIKTVKEQSQKRLEEKQEARRIEERRLENQRLEDLVKCTVFAPPTSSPGKNIMVQVFAHLYGEERVIRSLATKFDNKANIRASKLLENEIKRGSEITFCLSMQGVKIDEPVQKLIWRGQADSIQFGIYIPEDHPIDTIIGTVYVTQDSVPFGHVKFILRVEATVESPKSVNEKPAVNDTWKRYHYAFISYASPDRSEVLKRVQMLPRAGINFFQDLLTLEPGERWERALYKHIDKSDVFFLFWSNAAKNSQWVMQEVHYAMEKKGQSLSGNPEIVPIIIEGPPPVSPPPELKDLHFNDTFIYFINTR